MNMQPIAKTPFRLTLVAAALSAVVGAGFAGSVLAEDLPKAHSENMAAAFADTATTAKVKSKLMGDDRLKGSEISVTTTNGVVTLEGSAMDRDAKSLAGDLAKACDGVKSVDNKLVTASKTENEAKAKEAVASGKRVMTDTWITTKVKSMIVADSVSKGFDVKVDTRGGVVMLKGVLASQDAIERVKGIAAKVEGVKSVDTSALFVAGK